MTSEQYKALKKPFDSKFIKWRVGATNKEKTSGMAVAYLDSRAVQSRLDEVVGTDNWQVTYKVVNAHNSKEPVAYICRLSIYNAERGEWITKSNGASSTDIEPVKGGFSDAFKRAASTWGIGRYLYDLSSVWVGVDEYKRIRKSEEAVLNRKHDEMVAKIFEGNSDIQKPVPTANPASPQAPQLLPKSQATDNIFIVAEAKFNDKQKHTMLTLKSSDGSLITGFFNGEAAVGKNQRLSVKLTEKQSPNGSYYIVNEYEIAA